MNKRANWAPGNDSNEVGWLNAGGREERDITYNQKDPSLRRHRRWQHRGIYFYPLDAGGRATYHMLHVVDGAYQFLV